ncbi:vanadium-dependent haloperoxidase [Parvularcula lutaonensis]|uniref:Vanadium-dependent haloperoxidase n=1 Tax=Parvularcula lutaonensis TaxID=491923 RepID=A0ABV7M9M7_9PROT|nr:vanadium-dependent haloperoxidase [Parvularcula lutaonensis]GGY47172.1 vanadium-dependent haloperoxidase [Parvularcula lutaonensis]
MDDNAKDEGALAPSRRTLMKGTAGAAAMAALATPAARAHSSHHGGGGHPVLAEKAAIRRAKATKLRFEAARDQLRPDLPRQQTNGDEAFADKRASFFKTLPQNRFGEVNRQAYQKLLDALASGQQGDFDQIPLARIAQRKLANPQGAYKYTLSGRDGQNTWMRPAPTFLGAETAAEMGELYWKALCRDVPFSAYGSSPLIAAAVSDLNAFSATVGPKSGGSVTPETVFRGETPGDLAGPYISQLLTKPVPFGNTTIEQRYAAPAIGDDFMTTERSWRRVQRGIAPPPLLKGNPRYISDARALGEFVHVDFTFQAYQSAALILLGIPGSFDIGNLYNTNSTQGAFVSLGGPDVLDLVAKAGNLALTGAWYQKWLVHRRARPEVYGGRLHFQNTGERDYGLPQEILDSDGVGRTLAAQGTGFLSQAFPEGSPTHPAYPAGHATIAGACCTVLKAFFEESMAFPNPEEADATGQTLLPYSGTLTIGDEINKLANNISLGRDWAGVHYRSDGVDGLSVGEQQAISLLRDYSRTYSERFAGFTLTKFDGTRITINDGEIDTAGA